MQKTCRCIAGLAAILALTVFSAVAQGAAALKQAVQQRLTEVKQSMAHNGVILAQAGRFGGWSLYVRDGKPTYTYNWLGLRQYTVAAAQALPAGKATIKLDFAYDGGGVGKGGTATLFVNDKNVATGRIEQTQGMVFSADEGADVGADEGTAVTQAYKVPFKFTSEIQKVTSEVR